MRENKFRAWDKRLKRWCEGAKTVRIDFKFTDGDVVFQQFTGLKDKEGKEIYEGDILKNTTQRHQMSYEKTPHPIVTNICVVTWDNHWAEFKITKESEIGDLEIIGNIYENPELLENK